jgi:hypothetical protein
MLGSKWTRCILPSPVIPTVATIAAATIPYLPDFDFLYYTYYSGQSAWINKPTCHLILFFAL